MLFGKIVMKHQLCHCPRYEIFLIREGKFHGVENHLIIECKDGRGDLLCSNVPTKSYQLLSIVTTVVEVQGSCRKIRYNQKCL